MVQASELSDSAGELNKLMSDEENFQEELLGDVDALSSASPVSSLGSGSSNTPVDFGLSVEQKNARNGDSDKLAKYLAKFEAAYMKDRELLERELLYQKIEDIIRRQQEERVPKLRPRPQRRSLETIMGTRKVGRKPRKPVVQSLGSIGEDEEE